VQKDILEKIESSHLAVYTVWLPVLAKDEFHATGRARMTLPDTRVKHFWDGQAQLGHDYHQALSLAANCRMAWDVYLLFRAQTQWRNASPLLPTFWMHQLSCMSKELYLNTEVFRGEIERMLVAQK
jgi:hypothetical protein